jgi:hypothetical protein
MSTNVFKQLQERLNYYSIGFPETATGVELKILKELFTEDEASLFLSLSHRLEKPEAVAQRINRPLPDVAEQLEGMAGRGLLFRVKKGDSVRYAAIPFVHGLFEFQVSRLDRNLSELLEEYFQGGFLDAFNKSRGTFLRTIPVQKSLDATRNVAAFDDAAEINPDRCIGCGLCVTTCPSGALSLMQKKGDRYQVPPLTGTDQMMAMAQKRGLLS